MGMVFVLVNIKLDPERIHELVGYDDVRAALAADGAELGIHAMDVVDAKLLGTHTAARRLLAAASPRAHARGRGNCAAGGH